jgi:hypothetical protein
MGEQVVGVLTTKRVHRNTWEKTLNIFVCTYNNTSAICLWDRRTEIQTYMTDVVKWKVCTNLGTNWLAGRFGRYSG